MTDFASAPVKAVPSHRLGGRRPLNQPQFRHYEEKLVKFAMVFGHWQNLKPFLRSSVLAKDKHSKKQKYPNFNLGLLKTQGGYQFFENVCMINCQECAAFQSVGVWAPKNLGGKLLFRPRLPFWIFEASDKKSYFAKLDRRVQ